MLNKILLGLNAFLLGRNVLAAFEIMYVECSPAYWINTDLR